jgi:co-chaperonin GroES (HSP10)
VEGIKEGDIVHYDKHSGHNVEIDSVLYQVLRLPDIVLVE